MDKETGKLYRVWAMDSDMGTFTLGGLSDHKDLQIVYRDEVNEFYTKVKE